MKWIGQHIWDFVSKFRNDVYLENLSETTQDHVVSVDANGKLYKQDKATGDITGVTLAGDSGTASDTSGNVDLTIAGGNAITTSGSSTTITINHDDTSSQASVDNSGVTYIQDVTIDTYGHVTGLTSASIRSATDDTKGIASFSDTNFAIDDGAVTLQTWHQDAKVFGSNIKILPTDFMSNEDGGANKSSQFRDDTVIGVRTTHNDAELYAFVAIPQGRTATSVTVYGNDTSLAVNVYESDVNAGALTDKTPGGGCTVGSACDITDVASDATNYLAIKVTTVNYTNDIVYGGIVTLA